MKVGVIGTGNMGENHVRTYLSLNNHCQLMGIYDNDEMKKNQIAKRYQLKPFASMNELLQAVDAVSIAVPTKYHYEIGLACIDHNVHMLMEKPITHSIAQGEEIAKKSRNAGVKVQVGHIELYNPFIQALAKEVENETLIGIDFKRLSPYNDRLESVDVVKDLMIHDLYILNNLWKDAITEFYVFGKVIKSTPKHAVVISRSSKGGIAQLTASFKSKRKMREIQILTESAFIKADLLNRKISITQDMNEKTSKISVPITRTIYVDDSLQPLTAQLLDFIHCIQLDREPFVTAEDGINTLRLANQISDSTWK